MSRPRYIRFNDHNLSSPIPDSFYEDAHNPNLEVLNIIGSQLSYDEHVVPIIDHLPPHINFIYDTPKGGKGFLGKGVAWKLSETEIIPINFRLFSFLSLFNVIIMLFKK